MKMIFKKLITSEGWLTRTWGRVFSYGGIAIAVLPWFLEIDFMYCLLMAVAGSVVSLIASYEAKARLLGLPAPFTRDPIGWRKAKRTYGDNGSDDNE